MNRIEWEGGAVDSRDEDARESVAGEADRRVRGEPADGGLDVLVAVTDDERAHATIEVAAALSGRATRTDVLYVIEVSASIPDAAMVSVALEQALDDPARRVSQVAQMRALLHLDTGVRASWPFSIEVGDVASVIVREARRRESELIVMGLNRHAALGRAAGRDTARQVMSHAKIPVLAVRDTLRGHPRRIVVAVDFSGASIRAARLARRLLDPDGEMLLVFVEPGVLSGSTESAEGRRLIHDRGVEASFNDLIAELNPDGRISITTTVLKGGKPSAAILGLCKRVSPDMIAVGSQRHRLLDRLLLGSTARAIAADGRWSVLVTPPARAT